MYSVARVLDIGIIELNGHEHLRHASCAVGQTPGLDFSGELPITFQCTDACI